VGRFLWRSSQSTKSLRSENAHRILGIFYYLVTSWALVLDRPFMERIDKGLILKALGKASMKISKVFLDFKKITAQCELRRTLEFVIARSTYRVEVLYCYSNP
jgi:hypothetical protein